MTDSEYRYWVDREALRRLGMRADEFRRRYEAGELDGADPDVSLLAALTSA